MLIQCTKRIFSGMNILHNRRGTQILFPLLAQTRDSLTYKVMSPPSAPGREQPRSWNWQSEEEEGESEGLVLREPSPWGPHIARIHLEDPAALSPQVTPPSVIQPLEFALGRHLGFSENWVKMQVPLQRLNKAHCSGGMGEWVPGLGNQWGKNEGQWERKWGKTEDGTPWEAGGEAHPQKLCLLPHFPGEPACVHASSGNSPEMGRGCQPLAGPRRLCKYTFKEEGKHFLLLSQSRPPWDIQSPLQGPKVQTKLPQVERNQVGLDMSSALCRTSWSWPALTCAHLWCQPSWKQVSRGSC